MHFCTDMGQSLRTVPRLAQDPARGGAGATVQGRIHQHHTIRREELSVREHMSLMLRRLRDHRFVEFHELFEARRGPQLLVVTFIAMLELARERLLEMTQAEAFAPIYVRLTYQPS